MPSSIRKNIALALHGGAGVLRRDKPGSLHRAALEAALEAGYGILRAGGGSLDAVAAAVSVLEDSPLFNAGRGSCFNASAEIEMDASIMDGATLAAGAVAAVRRIRNPVLAARAVMEKSPHVLLSGKGAEAFDHNTIKKHEQLPLKLGMLNPIYYLMYSTGEKINITQIEGQFPQEILVLSLHGLPLAARDACLARRIRVPRASPTVDDSASGAGGIARTGPQ